MTDSARTAPRDQEVLITRIFDAPRNEVFAAWIDPDQVAQWYGPASCDTPREWVFIEPRIGGRWELTMVQRETRAEYSLSYEIVELVEPELLVLRSETTITRVELHDHGPKTRMTLTDGPYVESGGAEGGWHAALDKLATLVS